MQTNALKQFIHIIKQRIPQHIRLVAEIRLMWSDIVGEAMAKRSQPVKCEFLPKKNENGQITGEYHRRLLVFVKDDITQTAMTSYAFQYLEKIPKKYYIHSLRFQRTHQDLMSIDPSYTPKQPIYNISVEDKERIVKKVSSLTLPQDLERTMIDYFIVCKHQQNKSVESDEKTK